MVNVAADWPAISAKNKRETDNLARLSMGTISAAMTRRCRATDETRREFIKVPAGPPSVNASLMTRRAQRAGFAGNADNWPIFALLRPES
jgi:hypothetical protein